MLNLKKSICLIIMINRLFNILKMPKASKVYSKLCEGFFDSFGVVQLLSTSFSINLLSLQDKIETFFQYVSLINKNSMMPKASNVYRNWNNRNFFDSFGVVRFLSDCFSINILSLRDKNLKSLCNSVSSVTPC